MPLEEAAGRAKLATGAAAVWGAIGAAVIFAGLTLAQMPDLQVSAP